MTRFTDLVRLDSGLFPNIASEPGDMLARLDDGARVLCRPGADARLVIVRYVHGPYTEHEAERLGLKGAKIVRVRDVPEGRWADGPMPADLEHAATTIPSPLRGRLGTLTRLGHGNKYSQTAEVKMHRLTPGAPRENMNLPLVWLEPRSWHRPI